MTKFREKTNWSPELTFKDILQDTLDYWRKRISDESDTKLNMGEE